MNGDFFALFFKASLIASYAIGSEVLEMSCFVSNWHKIDKEIEFVNSEELLAA